MPSASLGPQAQWSGNQQQKRDESPMRGVALETLFLGVLVASALPEVTAWAPLPAALTRNPTPLAAARRPLDGGAMDGKSDCCVSVCFNPFRATVISPTRRNRPHL